MQNLGLHAQQSRLLGYPKLVEILNPEHILVKLRDAIPFEEMVEITSFGYSRTQGAPSKSIRKMVALELLKCKYGYSDKELVEVANTDLAVMYFCGYEYPTTESINSSTMTKFRNRITPEMAKMIQDVSIGKQLKKLHRKKRRSVQTDSTCVPENIKYPTDTGLLSSCIEKTFEIIEETRKRLGEKGKGIVIRGKRLLKKTMKSFVMKRRKTKKEIERMRKKLVKKASKYANEAEEYLGLLKENTHLIAEGVCGKFEQMLSTIDDIVAQQKEMLEKGANQVKNRIVSLHKPYVRPIYRGKAKAKTEFGPKVTMSVIGRRIAWVHTMENENVSDTEMPKKAIEDYERVTGEPPGELSTDRGGHSPKNHKLLKEKGIVDGIQYKGRIPKKNNQPPETTRKRLARGRSPMEGFIGVVKRKYGLGKIKFGENNRLGGLIFGTMMMNYCVNT